MPNYTMIVQFYSLHCSVNMSTKKEVLKVVQNFDLSEKVLECIKAIGIDDSFFITNVGEVVEKFFLWQELFPRVDPFYAIKSNNLKVVATTLAALGNFLIDFYSIQINMQIMNFLFFLGTGFDCASRGEIENVLIFKEKKSYQLFNLLLCLGSCYGR